MAGIKSISDVKDLYYLIELYAELDKNADGLLGPDEASAEEIAAGDKGGVGSANFDVKDGFLSPWEVAEMRGTAFFSVSAVAAMKAMNQKGRTFPDIEHLDRDLEIGGVTYMAGTKIHFDPAGTIYSGVIKGGMTMKDLVQAARKGADLSEIPDNFKYGNFTIPSGTELRRRKGRVVGITAKEDITLAGMRVPAGTRIVTQGAGGVKLRPPKNTIIQLHTIKFRDVYIAFEENGEARVLWGILAEDQTLPFAMTAKRSIELPFKGGTGIRINKGRVVTTGVLARDVHRFAGIDLYVPATSALYPRHGGGFSISAEDGDGATEDPLRIVYDSVGYHRLSFDAELKPSLGVLGNGTRVPLFANRSFSILFRVEKIRWEESFNAAGLPNVSMTEEPMLVSGVQCPPHTSIDHSELGDEITLTAPEGKFLLRGGVKLKSIRIHEDRSIRAIEFVEPTSMKVGSRRIKVWSMHFRADGSILSIKPAEDVYGLGSARSVFRKNEGIFFSRTGMPFEFTPGGFERAYPGIKMTGLSEPDEIGRTMMNLEEIPPAVRATIKSFYFGFKKDGKVEFLDDEGGHADPETMTIVLWKDKDMYLDAAGLQHEAAHIFTFHLQGIDGIHPPTDFEERWSRLGNASERYGKFTQKKDDKTVSTRWKYADSDGSTEGPRYGFMDSYGAQNFYEDVARHVETIWRDPDRYAQLIDPGSRFYAMHEDQKKYASVYRAKLELLREHGFITEEKYREILPQKPKAKHPRIASVCAREAVNCP